MCFNFNVSTYGSSTRSAKHREIYGANLVPKRCADTPQKTKHAGKFNQTYAIKLSMFFSNSCYLWDEQYNFRGIHVSQNRGGYIWTERSTEAWTKNSCLKNYWYSSFFGETYLTRNKKSSHPEKSREIILNKCRISKGISTKPFGKKIFPKFLKLFPQTEFAKNLGIWVVKILGPKG